MDLSMKSTAIIPTTQNTWTHYPQTMDRYRYSYETSIDFSYQQQSSALLRNSSIEGANQRFSPLSNNSNESTTASPSSSLSYKRQRTSSESEHKSCSSDDSGIDLTPKRHQPDNYQLLANQVRGPITIHDVIPTIKHGLSLNTAAPALTNILSEDKLYNIFTFHDNMVREFPQKERSAKEQEKRYRNTIACRKNRRLQILKDIALAEQSKEREQQLTEWMEQKLRVKALLAHLMGESSKIEQGQENINAEETEPEIDVVGLDDEHAAVLAPVAGGEWKYNECVGKIQWQPFSAVTTPQTAFTPPSEVSLFSIDYLLRN